MRTWNYLSVDQADEHILIVTMNRPQRRNAMNVEMAQELEALLVEIREREDLRVLIVTGAGSAFGAGADLKEREGLDPETTRRQRETALRIVELLETMRAPSIAMINGPAVAGGLEIALGCDIRIASDKATFALSEVRNAGSFPGAGGPIRLAKLLGRGRASYIVLTGRSFSAHQALQFGMVELVVPHDELADRTLEVARDIAGNSPLGVRAAKTLIRQSNELDLYSATTLSRALRDPLDSTRDYAEGLNAWLEKRKPRFTGR